MSGISISSDEIEFSLKSMSFSFGIKNLGRVNIFVKGFISFTITLRHNRPDSIAVVHLPLKGS
jgi:hypothetical protein